VNKSCSVPSGKGTTIGTVSGPFLTGILVLVVAFTTNDVFLLFAIVLARNRLVSPTDDIIDDTLLLLRVAVVFVFVVVLAEDDGDGDGVVGVVGVRNISLFPSLLLRFFGLIPEGWGVLNKGMTRTRSRQMFLLLYSIKLVVFLRQRNDDAEKHDSRESENLLPLLKTLFRKVNE
jgi:hypothetical protein